MDIPGANLLEALTDACSSPRGRMLIGHVDRGPRTARFRIRSILNDLAHERARFCEIGIRPRESFEVWAVVARDWDEPYSRLGSCSRMS